MTFEKPRFARAKGYRTQSYAVLFFQGSRPDTKINYSERRMQRAALNVERIVGRRKLPDGPNKAPCRRAAYGTSLPRPTYCP